MNKLDILQAAQELEVVTSKNLAKHLRIPRARAAWFLLRLQRQSLLSRELSQEERDTRGRRPYLYRLKPRGHERMRYLEGQLST